MSGTCFRKNGRKDKWDVNKTRLATSWNYWNWVMGSYSYVACVCIFHDKVRAVKKIKEGKIK